MNRNSISAASISEADALARALYRKARLSGPDFADVATVVRGLHTVLKHLRVEAEDPDSLLNTNQQQHSVYARQLAPIVEDCDFTLKQLDTILEKYGGSSADSPTSASGAPPVIVGTVESREKDMIALIRTKLANQKTNIDIFLDTVQLHNPANARRPIDNSQSSNPHQLDIIKDKVAAIAARIAQRRPADSPTTSFAPTAMAGGSSNSFGSDQEEEELWQQFCTELTKEGFSSEVLMRNKEVLRAYIRELDSNGLLDGDSQPSVRGLLDEGPAPALPPRGPPVTITPASYAHELPVGPDGGMSPKEVVYPATENEKFLPSVKLDRRPPDYSNASAAPSSQPRQNIPLHGQNPSQSPNPNLHANMNQSPPPQSQQGQLQNFNPYHPHNLGLSQGQPQPSGQNNQLQAYNYPYAPPSPRLLQPPSFRNNRSGFSSASGESDSDSDSDYSNNMRLISGLSLISTLDLMQLDQLAAERLAARMAGMHLQPQLPAPQSFCPGTSPSNRYLPAPPQPSDHVLSSSPGQMSVSPRYVPPLPPPYTSPASSISSPTTVVASPPPAYNNANGGPSTALQPHQQVPRLYSRLQPDSEGRDIPPEAMWTKIRRTLVSPEVLSKAGVRYEARPDFVAVLGVLTRAQIAEFARQSDEVRRQRGGYGGGGGAGSGKKQYPPPRYMRGGNGSGSFRDEKRRSGSTSDSESENLWDESDTSSDEERDRRRESRRYRSERDRDSKSEKDRLKERDEKEKQQSSDKEEDKGTKVYPFILPLSAGLLAKGASSLGGGDSKGGAPSSAAQPKPILKNKNENHVRFNRDGPIEISPEEAAAEQRQRERRNRERADRDRDRDWDRERDRARERERRRRDREADRSGDRSDRSRDDRENRPRDRDHHRDSGHHRSSRHHRGSHSANDDRSSRDRDAQKQDKRKAWGEKAKYAGIGGAAASLLNVLTEAASGF